MTLPELCASQRINYSEVESAIRNQAETDFADAKDIGITFETFLSMRVMAATIQARKDPEYLKSII